MVCTRFGPPEVLQLREVPKPVPQDHEVLLKIHAAAVARNDPDMRQRGFNGFIRPRRPIIGGCLAGEVEATGKDMQRFHPGDRIYGDTSTTVMGAYAEYVCVPEADVLAIMPATMTYEQAAAIPDGFLTALPFLRDQGHTHSGQRVLVNGASGAVGSAALQLARCFGVEVTGVCSTANVELVRSLGADRVIDYTHEDFTRTGPYDLIFDAVAKSSFARCKDALTPGGTFLTTSPFPDGPRMLWTHGNGKKVRFAATGLRPAAQKAQDLAFVREWIEAGKIRAVIDRTYPLEQVADAHRYVEQGHKRGNVVIRVEHTAPDLTGLRDL